MLKKKVVAASAWSLIEVLGRQSLSLVVTFILARLLTPEDFGAVALVAVATSFAGIFADGGFSYALIQRKDIDSNDLSSVFWFNLLTAILFASGLYGIGPLLATYFNSPAIEQLVLPFAMSIVLGAASSVHLALMTKGLAFKKIAIANSIAIAISGGVAIVLALYEWGVWALAAQALSASALGCLALWQISAWRPAFVLKYTSLVKLFPFGGYMFLSAVLDKAQYGLQNLLIGKLYSVRDIGYYGKAEATLNFPQSIVGAVVTRVLFPLFSSISDDRARMLRGLRQSIRIAMLIAAPLIIGLMATAEVAVRVLLGDRWDDAIPLLAVLCCGGLFWPIHAIHLNVLSGTGRSDLFFLVEVVKKILAIVFLLALSQFGVIWIAWAQVVTVLLACAVTMWLSKKLLGYSIVSQLMDFSPPILAATAMGLAIWVLSLQVNSAALSKLSMLIVVGGVFYVFVCWSLKMIAFKEALHLLFPDSKSH